VKIERGLRAAAVLIAVVAWLDPAWSGTGTERANVVVLDTPAGDPALGTHIASMLGESFDVSRAEVPAPAAYVLAGRDVPTAWRPAPGAVVFSVTPEPTAKDLRILRLSVTEELSIDSMGLVDDELFIGGTDERTLTVALLVDGVRVQEVRQQVAGGDTRATIPLRFVAARPGVTRIRVEAGVPGRRPAIADASVDVAGRIWQVLAYDSRPTYAATFVKRALEADSRFKVSTRVATSRSSAIVSTAAPRSLSDTESLDSYDLIIVGAPEALGTSEAAALERYLRERHGAVALLPEGADGEVLRSLTGQARWNEDRRLSAVGVARDGNSWAAGEFLWPATWPDLVEPLAAFAVAESRSVPRHPVWQVPVGSGRLIVSSAIDGWRSRAGAALGFSAFWRSVAAAAADATPPVVDVQVPDQLVRPGQAMEIRVEVFTDTEPTAAVRDTGGVMSPVRLWRPVSGAAGSTRRWECAIRAPEMPGRYRIEVATAAYATGIA
jgi:hypothetical protein